ncbi:hypothetical protein, partial [Clostridium perfringens]
MDFKRYIKIVITLFFTIAVIMCMGVIVRFSLLKIKFVEDNITPFITGYFTITALIGTGLTLGNTWQVSKEKNLVDVVTKNRSEWVKEMKELFSDYFTKYDELKEYKNSENTNNSNKDSENNKSSGDTLIQIRNKISLRLNPNGVIDNEILLILDSLINKSKETNIYEKDKGEEEVVSNLEYKESLRKIAENKIKVYLKCEWERIKFETKEGLKEYDFEYEFEKIQLINHIYNENAKFLESLISSENLS